MKTPPLDVSDGDYGEWRPHGGHRYVRGLFHKDFAHGVALAHDVDAGSEGGGGDAAAVEIVINGFGGVICRLGNRGAPGRELSAHTYAFSRRYTQAVKRTVGILYKVLAGINHVLPSCLYNQTVKPGILIGIDKQPDLRIIAYIIAVP